jgi:CheY-like chemotaxis protein
MSPGTLTINGLSFATVYIMHRSEPLKHIILADDDADHRILFQHMLQQVSPQNQVTLVKDGEELMHFLSGIVPHILFLDLHMPCKHGLECLHEIRKDERLQNLHVIVYTSSPDMTNIQKSYLNKADLYMVKPFNSQQLKNALESVLQMEWKSLSDHRHYFINNRFVPFTA